MIDVKAINASLIFLAHLTQPSPAVFKATPEQEVFEESGSEEKEEEKARNPTLAKKSTATPKSRKMNARKEEADTLNLRRSARRK
jgi:hypothetical protein